MYGKNELSLNNRDKKKYYEMCAKYILEDMFSGEYIKLIHQDKPDLIDIGQNIGIEVTRAINPDAAAAISEWHQSFYEIDEKEKEKHLKKVERYGEKYNEEIQGWHKSMWAVDMVMDAIENKIDKYINYKYAITDLFVDTSGNYFIPNIHDSLDHFGNTISTYLNELNIAYRYIYVVVIGYIYKFDIKNNTYKIYPFSSEKASEIRERAKQYVLQQN